LWIFSGAAEPLFAPDAAGLRIGSSANSRGGQFFDSEVFVDWKLPVQWELPADWNWQLRTETTLGYLSARGKNTLFGGLGPDVVIRPQGWRVSLNAGSNFVMLGRHQFGQKDLGDNFEFATHVGLNVDLARHLGIGYQYQHVSNAGLGIRNPGLNLHLIAIAYLF
jgi:hypothetical protein